MSNSLQELPTVNKMSAKEIYSANKLKPKKFKLMLHTNTSNVQFIQDSNKHIGIGSSKGTGKYTNLTQRSESKRLR